MVRRSKGRRKAARALKEASGGTGGGDSAGSPEPKAKPAAALPKGGSSKPRDGARGGRRGGDDDERRERARVARPQGSPAPFIIAGAFILVAILIVVIIANREKETRYVSSPDSEDGHEYSGTGSSASGGYSAGRSAAAPVRPRGGSAHVEIRFVQTGLSSKGDGRYMTAACGRCGTRFTSRVEICPNASCGARIRWPDGKKKCKFCRPHDKLTVEDLNEIPEDDRDGFCAFCGGSGKAPGYEGGGGSYIAFGLTRDGSGSGIKPGACPVCKGTGKCMRCMGTGWIAIPDTFGE